jgi:hypothetical protein
LRTYLTRNLSGQSEKDIRRLALAELDRHLAAFYLTGEELIDSQFFEQYLKRYQLPKEQFLLAISTAQRSCQQFVEEMQHFYLERVATLRKERRACTFQWVHFQTENVPGQLNRLTEPLTSLKLNIGIDFQCAGIEDVLAEMLLGIVTLKNPAIAEIQRYQIRRIIQSFSNNFFSTHKLQQILARLPNPEARKSLIETLFIKVGGDDDVPLLINRHPLSTLLEHIRDLEARAILDAPTARELGLSVERELCPSEVPPTIALQFALVMFLRLGSIAFV